MQEKLKLNRGVIAAIAPLGNFNGVERVAIVFQSDSLIMSHGPYLGQNKVYTLTYEVGSVDWKVLLQNSNAMKALELLNQEVSLVMDVNIGKLKFIIHNMFKSYELPTFKAAEQDLPAWLCDMPIKIYTSSMVLNSRSKQIAQIKRIKEK